MIMLVLLLVAAAHGLSISTGNAAYAQNYGSAAAVDQAANAALEVAERAAASGDRFVVLELPEGMDAKGMQPLVQKVLKQSLV